MSKYSIENASTTNLKNWDKFVDTSINGTIYHKRKFLSYHGRLYKNNERWRVIKKGNEVIAQISYCLFEDDDLIFGRSPYGGSYGGFILKDQPNYKTISEIVKLFNDHLIRNNIYSFIITHPIACCSVTHLDLIPYVLIENGYQSISRQISSIINLSNGNIEDIVSSRARNMEKKAINNGLVLRQSAPIDDFWVPMSETFKKHSSKPTHTKNQLQILMKKFPKEITLDVAYLKNEPIAGVCYFAINKRLKCTFYFCQKTKTQKYQGLSYLVMSGLRKAKMEGYKYLDFGTTSLENYFSFKESFSRDTNTRETFEWNRIR